MKRWIKWFLNFLRITDETGILSITNMLVYIFAIKYAMAPVQASSIQDMALALGAMGIYMGKKVVSTIAQGKAPSVADDVLNKIKDMAE